MKDYIKLYVQAGKGGNGCVSFRREKYVPFGNPDGGDGGKGGDVIIKADASIKDLTSFIYKTYFRAQKGKDGQGKNKTGKKGKDCIIKVPLGTVVKNEENNIIKDLISPEESVIVAYGGKQGRGNAKFATSSFQAPRFAEKGLQGEKKTIILELKLIADIGLIGLPNAGKSTLLRAISSAKPKIASYPFTTLSPVLGVVKSNKQTLTVAEIPGLIKGAHKGKGLGFNFLRHIERTKALVYLLDFSNLSLDDPLADFNVLYQELKLYNPLLIKKPYLIIGNKIDLEIAQNNFKKIKDIIDIFPISAFKCINIKKLIEKITTLLTQ